jgi:hypothetical protein
MRKKKLKIYQEEAKLRQTIHWDLDYMTTAEIDALFNVKQAQKTQDPSETQDNSGTTATHVGKINDVKQGLWQQRSQGKTVVATLLRPFKWLGGLLRHRVYSPNH